MKRIIAILMMLSLTAIGTYAQKTVYIPNEWKNPWPSDSLLYKESDPDNKYTWSKSRSVESDNVIVFWDKNYGTKKPSESPSAYRVDEQDLLQKCEAFFDLEINKLGFVDAVTSNLSKYKVMVLMNHTTDWVCYGGGYDYQVSALWLSPSTCKPVGHSVAHEVGHSFHYMCYAEHSGHKDSQTDNTGFHLPCGSGQTIWEQTAQWQANQSYPSEMFNQSISIFRKSHNLAYSHEWHRYQSYWLHYYLGQHYNDITTVAQVWNQPMTGQTSGNATDFNQALMKLMGLDAKGLFRLYYDYAARCAEKLRQQNTVATIVGVFVNTNMFREDLAQYWNFQEARLITSTNSTIAIVKAACDVLQQIYRPGYQYKKAGVIVMGIGPDSPIQQDLFDVNAEQIEKMRRLDQVVDRINRLHGSETIVIGAQQYTKKDGKGRADVFANAIKHDFRSKNPTTRWSDIIELK